MGKQNGLLVAFRQANVEKEGMGGREAVDTSTDGLNSKKHRFYRETEAEVENTVESPASIAVKCT
jgi:hypothetical protein